MRTVPTSPRVLVDRCPGPWPLAAALAMPDHHIPQALPHPPPATPVLHIPTSSAHTYPPPVGPSPDQPPTDPPWPVGPSPTQVDATNFVAIGMLQEPPPALPIRASLQVGDTQEIQDQFYYSVPPLGLPPVSGAAVYLHDLP
jgi:hypothetical protein